MKYIVITPAFNEEKYIRTTAESMVSQSLSPSEWIIVDDNSTDKTYSIATGFTDMHDWIKVVKKTDSAQIKKVGAKVVQAFNYGLKSIENMDFAFIVKLDADLKLPPNYFFEIANAFKNNPKVGIAGGYCYVQTDNGPKREKSASYHIRGALKSIRRECWHDIGGFKDVLGWDGLDEMAAMYKGWKTMNLDLPVLQLRPTAGDYGDQRFAKRKGFVSYQNGCNFFLMTIRALARVNKRPYLLYPSSYVLGYLSAMMKRAPKNVSPDLAQFINHFHLTRLLSFRRY